MKLSEIYKIGKQAADNINLNDFDLTNIKVVALSENPLRIVKVLCRSNPAVILYGIQDIDNQLLCYIIGRNRIVYGVKYFVIGGTWTIPTKRKQGLMTSLYTGLVKNLHLKLLSDRSMSDGAIQLWKSIQRLYTVRVLDVKNNKILNKSDISDDELFHDDESIDDYRLILEYIETSPIPNIGNMIIYEHQIFTHPNNIGKYD